MRRFENTVPDALKEAKDGEWVHVEDAAAEIEQEAERLEADLATALARIAELGAKVLELAEHIGKMSDEYETEAKKRQALRLEIERLYREYVAK